MLEISFRYSVSDDTSSDEALIAGIAQDLRAIADHLAQAWPGGALDRSLGEAGRLVRPARLEVELAHGGQARVEVRQSPAPTETPAPVIGAGRKPAPLPRSAPAEPDLDELLIELVSPDRWAELRRDTEFLRALGRTEEALAGARPADAQNTRRLLRSFAGGFRDLVAKDRSGYWVSVAKTPTSDPYYVCAVFDRSGVRSRVPLPKILPEAAEARRSFSLSPDNEQALALLDYVVPAKLGAVRAAGRDYLARRREWLSQGYFKK